MCAQTCSDIFKEAALLIACPNKLVVPPSISARLLCYHTLDLLLSHIVREAQSEPLTRIWIIFHIPKTRPFHPSVPMPEYLAFRPSAFLPFLVDLTDLFPHSAYLLHSQPLQVCATVLHFSFPWPSSIHAHSHPLHLIPCLTFFLFYIKHL